MPQLTMRTVWGSLPLGPSNGDGPPRYWRCGSCCHCWREGELDGAAACPGCRARGALAEVRPESNQPEGVMP